MRAALAKFGFIHRRLWQRDGLYRAALLLGPAALIGIVAVIAVTEGMRVLGGSSSHTPRPAWGVPQRADMWDANDDQPQSAQPSSPLPPVTANGQLSGYVLGWRATINQLEAAQAFEVTLKRDPISGFDYVGSTIDMTRLLAEGPKSSLFAGVGSAFLAVKTAGIYTLTVKFERPAGQAANCLLRLGFGGKRVVSQVELSVVNEIAQTFDAVKFDLQPGLYSTSWAFGCWHEHDELGPGQMTVLVGHPNDPQLQPARPDDFVRLKP